MKIERAKRKKILIVLTCILIAALGVMVYVLMRGESTEKPAEVEQNEVIDNDNVIEDAELETDEEQVSAFEIETEYCTLYYPETWKDQIEVKFSEEAGYKAEFYGLVEGKDAQHLFDICFNSDEGELLGYFENEAEIINVSIDVFELEFDDSWSQKEADQIYSMQEEMNFVMEMLGENDNYVTP